MASLALGAPLETLWKCKMRAFCQRIAAEIRKIQRRVGKSRDRRSGVDGSAKLEKLRGAKLNLAPPWRGTFMVLWVWSGNECREEFLGRSCIQNGFADILKDDKTGWFSNLCCWDLRVDWIFHVSSSCPHLTVPTV